MTVLELLFEMRESRQHLALVVDEFGGIDGMVTIEDLVEEIVGDIADEHDTNQSPEMRHIGDGTWAIDARVPLEVLEETFGTLVDPEDEEDIDTVGGLVFSLAGRIPGRGELIRHDAGLEFEIVDADPRRIRRLVVRQDPAPRTKGEADLSTENQRGAAPTPDAAGTGHEGREHTPEPEGSSGPKSTVGPESDGPDRRPGTAGPAA
jgi:CBS domain containing-hemolysin-like protein